MQRTRSQAAYREALKYIPGGVNSPVRALKAVGETPLFIDHAKGATITDIDGNEYIDFCLSWGVFILGHSHPEVLSQVGRQISRGTSYGIPTQQETELAKLVNHFIPSMERVRFVNSGTEAVMSAIRLARGYTQRDIIVKFEGCYHGHVDHLLVAAGSGVATMGISSSAGVPDCFVSHTVCLPFNDKKAVERLFAERGGEIAAVIVEPVPANMGVVPEHDGFLQYLRDITALAGSLLIFDEVITGFRLTRGGAQQLYGISPDLTTVGKIVGGGFPAAAFGGRADIMALLAPDGPVYQAGTLSGNPVAMTAGMATLNILSQEGVYDELNAKATRFINALADILRPKGIVVQSVANMFTPFVGDHNAAIKREKSSSLGLSSVSRVNAVNAATVGTYPCGRPHPYRNFDDVNRCDTERFAAFFRHMLSNGIYISPSQFETNFISIAHTEAQLEHVLAAADSYN